LGKLTAAAIVAVVVALVQNTGIFHKEPIDKKYCYVFNGQNIDYVMIGSDINEARIYKSFYVDSTIETVSGSSIGFAPYQRKCEIMKYAEDSLYAKIRVKAPGAKQSMITYRGWVSTLTLHDTLPKKIRKEMKRKEMGYD